MYEQLAQGCYVSVKRPGVEHLLTLDVYPSEYYHLGPDLTPTITSGPAPIRHRVALGGVI